MAHATSEDIEDILQLCIRAHDVSEAYQGIGYDIDVARRNLKGMLMSPLVFIGYNGTGVIIGVASPSWYRNGYDVADVFFYAEKNGLQLIKEYIAWAKDFLSPDISLGVTFGGEAGERTERLYEKLGLERVGSTFKVKI
jgi:hypothetical protein